MNSLTFPPRHCERSEAIQFPNAWIATSPTAPRNDELNSLRHAELVSASIKPSARTVEVEAWTLKQVQGDGFVGDFEGSVR